MLSLSQELPPKVIIPRSKKVTATLCNNSFNTSTIEADLNEYTAYTHRLVDIIINGEQLKLVFSPRNPEMKTYVEYDFDMSFTDNMSMIAVITEITKYHQIRIGTELRLVRELYNFQNKCKGSNVTVYVKNVLQKSNLMYIVSDEGKYAVFHINDFVKTLLLKSIVVVNKVLGDAA